MDLKTRATNILIKPATEWTAIAGEATTANELIMTYAAPLAAVAAVCGFIGQTMIGVSVPVIGLMRLGIVRGLVWTIVSFVVGLVGVYIAALIVEKLAPTFQSRGDTVQALKLVVYAYTPVWIAGVLWIVPPLAPLVVIAGLYAIYLFYLGLPHVMRTPDGQVVPYMAVAALVTIVVSYVLGQVTATLAGVGAYPVL